jgi:mannosyltransferase
LWQVHRPELWRDELSSLSIASRGVAEMLATARNTDGAELPYYLLLHYWIAAFGSSVLSLRLLSVLAMAGAAAFVTLAARRLAGTRAAITAGLVFAVIPSVSRFAQEVRFYALTMLMAALATWLLTRALDRPSWARWVGYAVAMTALGYSDLVAMSLLVGHGAWAALRWWHERKLRLVAGFAASAAVGVALCVPLILIGSKEAAAQVGWVEHLGLHPVRWWDFDSNLFYSWAAAAGVPVLAALAWLSRKDRRVVGYLTVAVLGPIAAVWLYSLGPISYLFARYVMFTLIGVSILVGITASWLGTRLGSRLGSRTAYVPAVAAVVLVAALGISDQIQVRGADAHNWVGYPYSTVVAGSFDWVEASRIVGENAEPGDGIAYTDNQTSWEQVNLGLAYYLPDYLRKGVPEPRVLFTAKTAAQSDGLYPIPCAQPERCVGDESRVWLVGGSLPPDPLTMLLPAEANVLRQRYTVSRTWNVGSNMSVVLLTRAPTTTNTPTTTKR